MPRSVEVVLVALTMGSIIREGVNAVWGVFVLVAVIGLLILDFYWLFTESGPIRWLAVKEAAVFGGKWYPKITFLFFFLAQIGALLLLMKVIELVRGKKLAPPP